MINTNAYPLSANDFPMGVTRPASMYYEDSFLVMGGDGADSCTGCTCTRHMRDNIFK